MSSRILIKKHSCKIFIEADHFYISQVSSNQNLLGRLVPGPGNFSEAKLGCVASKFHRGGLRTHFRHQSMDVGSLGDGLVPVRMLVFIQRQAGLNYIFQMALPAVAALVSRQAIQHRLIGRFLQVQIQ